MIHIGLSRRWPQICACWAALAATACATGSAAEAPSLEQQLHQHAPAILARLRERQCRHVGVLKFRVEKPGRSVTDNVGTLNQFVAERLEAALALANSADAKEQIQLVRNASATAATIQKATHLTPVGRSLLFTTEYPAAWGAQKIPVDAFITGVIRFAADNKSLTLGIMAFRPGDKNLELLLPPIKVATSGSILHEAGESFQVRSIDGQPQAADPAHSSLAVRKTPQQNFPLQDNPSVMLRILYDREPVKVTFVDGEAWIPEPRAGQKVWLELERMDRGEGALGVVLKVNGENTLYQQRLRDIDCAKWVLTREKRAGTIRGFQMKDNKQAIAFRVASNDESEDLEMYYGPDVGTISMVIFPEATAAPFIPPRRDRANPLDEDAPDLVAISKAQFPDDPPPDAEALKAQLRSVGDGFRTRGVITDGDRIDQEIKTVDYDWHSEPIMSAVIRYYPAKLSR